MNIKLLTILKALLFYPFSKFILISTCLLVTFSGKADYHSQVGQDKFINETFFKNKTNGVFVDIGAHDGKTGSNSYFFEKELQWTGFCFEPLPHLFEQLKSSRKCVCLNTCVSAINGLVPFIHVDSIDEMLSGMASTYDQRQLDIVIRDINYYGGCKNFSVPSVTLSSILDQHSVNHIDFLSVDTEGSELEILQSIDYKKYSIDVITVENNYSNSKIGEFLTSQGFTFVTALWPDEIYVSNNFLKRQLL